MSDAGAGWEALLADWARRRPDVVALVQIGSRVQPEGSVDPYSDYDYHLIVRDVKAFRDGSFAREIAPLWTCGAHMAFGSALKVTAVFEGALEADFVVLDALDLRIAFAAMRYPASRFLWPPILRRGIEQLRIIAAPGWKVIKGGEPWKRRYERVGPPSDNPLLKGLDFERFEQMDGNFWAQAVWAAKKALRGEYLACQRGVHEHLVEACLRIMQEEARLAGRPSRPLGRRAETWLTASQIEALSRGTKPEPVRLAEAILGCAEAYARSAQSVAAARGWKIRPNADVRAWLSGALVRLTGKAPQ